MHAQAWDPADTFGRIKVTISEGLARVYSPELPRSGGFDRFRDIVVFSFQHAPVAVLEYSEIAWPNMQSFQRARTQLLRHRPSTHLGRSNMGHEAHAHSPRRASLACPPNAMVHHTDQNVCMSHNCMFPDHQTPRDLGRTGLQQSRWASNSALTGNGMANVLRAHEDPFMGPPAAPVYRSNRTRSPSHDLSMEDYVSSKSNHSQAHTEMSGVTYPPKDFGRTMHEAAVEEIIEALSPVKRDQLFRALSPEKESYTGTDPPNNTPSSGPPVGRSSTPKSSNQIGAGTLNEDSGNLKVVGGRSRSTGSNKMKSAPSSIRSAQRNDSPASSSVSIKETFLSPEDGNENTTMQIDLTNDEDGSGRHRSTSNASKRKRSISLRTASVNTSGIAHTERLDV